MVGVAALIVLASSCGDPVCVPPPCPQQIAFDVSVTTPDGAAVPGLAISVAGPSGAAGCLLMSPADPKYCAVTGSRGTYQLSISAPGFRSVQQTIQVTSSGTHGCDSCDIPNTQHLSFALTPA
jgi:hypothetical protein